MENIFSAENAVIGSMLLDPQCVGELIHALTPDDFRQETARTLFSTVRSRFLSGLAIDPVTVSEKLQDGERQFMAECMRATPTANNFREYGEMVKKSGQLHRRQLLGLRLADARELEETEDVIDRLIATSAASGREERFQSGAQAADSFYSRLTERIENGTGFIRWGLYPLDDVLNTLPGNLVVIGARPSCGKSAFALQTALYMAAEGRRVGFVSLEMSAEEITHRIVSRLSGVSFERIYHHPEALSDNEHKRIIAACEKLYSLPIGFDYGARTAAQIKARALSERWEVCFIDYLQLLGGNRKASRYEQVTEISQELQCMAHQHKILTVALSQLSRLQRTADGRERRPCLSDLRDSGQIEQDADAVMLMSLEDSGDKGADRLVQLAKNRQGVCCDFLLSFDGDRQTFTYRKRGEASA